MPEATVEILAFDGCPNRDRAIALVEAIVADADVDAKVRVIAVPDAEAAQRTRFLGSPTIRVNGRDIEPGADGRCDFFYGCRVFRTGSGLSGTPDPQWLRAALVEHAGRPA